MRLFRRRSVARQELPGRIPPGSLQITPNGASMSTPNPGMPGFAGGGEFDLAVGSVTGYRWFCLPHLSLAPGPLLRGATGRFDWRPGLNTAVCNYSPLHRPPVETDPETGLECGCGFWGYWDAFRQPGGLSGVKVAGVIEGTGRTLAADLGFRCEQARIVALHVPPDQFAARHYTALRAEFGRYLNGPEVSFRSITGVTSPGAEETFRAFGGGHARPSHSQETELWLMAEHRALAEVTEELWLMAEHRALAQVTEIEEYLSEAYPEADICATLRYMRLRHPPAGRP